MIIIKKILISITIIFICITTLYSQAFSQMHSQSTFSTKQPMTDGYYKIKIPTTSFISPARLSDGYFASQSNKADSIFLNLIDSFASSGDASSLTISDLVGAGVNNVIESYISFYRQVIENQDRIFTLFKIQSLIDSVNAVESSISDFVVNFDEDNSYYFKNEDFNFQSIDDHEIIGIIITNTVQNGKLLYNGENIEQGQLISDISKLSFVPNENEFGKLYSSFSYKVKESSGIESFSESIIEFDINPQIDGEPLVTDAATDFNTQSSEGLIIKNNLLDGQEIEFFKISSIENGLLFLNDGITQIYNNQFITREQALQGLKWTPETDSSLDGSFFVQASLFDNDSGLGGEIAKAIINVLEQLFNISGKINYYSNNIPLNNVLISLDSSSPVTITTDENGQYSFSNISKGVFDLKPQKTDNKDGLSAVDVSRISRHVVGLYDFNNYQKIAADVTGDGKISSTDASRVARYVLGFISSLNTNDLNWKFVSQSLEISSIWPFFNEFSFINFNPLESNFFEQNFYGLRVGDVNGSWTNNTTRKINKSYEIIDKNVFEGQEINIPIYLTQETEIEGIDAEIKYDHEILEPINVSLNNGILENNNYNILINKNTKGLITFLIYAKSKPIIGSGIFAYISFNLIGKENSSTLLSDSNILCNDYPIKGGFFENNIVTHKLRINILKADSIITYDYNMDKKVNLEDILYLISAVSKDNNEKDGFNLTEIIKILQLLTRCE